MTSRNTVHSLRVRYIIGLSAIALLVTASFITLIGVVSKQRDFSKLINLAGHQSGLSNRIAYFASLMAATKDESEFSMARSQVGLTIHKMTDAHRRLKNGDPENGIPLVSSDALTTIYSNPMVGLDTALENYMERAREIYNSDMEALTTGSIALIYITNYGPHVLEPLLDAAVEEYENIGRAAILKIERLELIIWISSMMILLIEVGFIFRPLERQVQSTLHSLESNVEKLKNTRERLEKAQNMAQVGDWILVPETGELNWSNQVYKICGRSREDFELNEKSSLELVHPEDRDMMASMLRSLTPANPSIEMECRVIHRDGKERLVHQHAKAVFDQNGAAATVSGTIQDITERKELSIRLEKLSEHVPGFIFQLYLDPEGNATLPYTSKGIIDTCGIRPDQVVHDFNGMYDLLHEEDRERVTDKFLDSSSNLEPWTDQYRINHPDKGVIWLEGHATPERVNNGAILWYGYVWDITDRKNSDNQIRKLALYDPLTGLANRRLLKDRLSHAIAASSRNLNWGAVMMLDLDNFKILNDTKGHNVGDALLIEVGKRLRGSVREADTVARLGGDEFVVILEWLSTEREDAFKKAQEVAEKIRVILNNAYVLGKGKHAYHTSASIGVGLFRGDRKGVSEMLKRADVAMYEAKDLGRNRICFYSEVRQAIIDRRSALAGDMQVALEREDFSLFLQPQYSSEGTICSAEALLRWEPRGKEPVSPGVFIPIAESTGLILQLGEWVLKKACHYIIELESHGLPENFSIAVNISARQFSDEHFVDKVKAIIHKSGIETRRLKLELTETCLVQDLERGNRILSELRDMGIHIELDDFGTGYSSLSVLNKLPLSTLKIDRSLIHGILNESSCRAIVRATIAMAKAMSMNTIAEGVEDSTQSEFLINEGCDVLQGFLYARPMSYTEFIDYIDQPVDKPILKFSKQG